MPEIKLKRSNSNLNVVGNNLLLISHNLKIQLAVKLQTFLLPKLAIATLPWHLWPNVLWVIITNSNPCHFHRLKMFKKPVKII